MGERSAVPPIRILLVDDYKDWRNQVRLLLRERPEWQIIFEASDGFEAVQKAGELRPDIILLDIGLPKLDGIETARRIRQHSPNSKIVFLSQQNSLDFVQEALSTGAQGYVYKASAQSDLLPAIDAVLRGIQFFPSMLTGHMPTDTTRAKTPHHHEVQFYSHDTVLLDRLVRFVISVLGAGNVAIVVATESHRDRLAERLKSEGLDVDAAIIEGTYIPVDAVSTLSLFIVKDMPDSARFVEVVGCLIEQAAKKGKAEHPRVAVFGEWVSLLCAEGKTDAVVRLEQLGNHLATTYEIDILCGYELSSFHGEEDGKVVQRICAEHSAVYI
jgi:DNA-binding NarL/FixJ family response regulator